MGENLMRIERRFRGPPDSGNGGYVAGLLAGALGGSDVKVTLRAPPPLERELRLVANDDGAELRDGELLLATAARSAVTLDVPPPPSLGDAQAATARFAGFAQHMFPGCFVCGPDRGVGDGLCIFPGDLAGEVSRVAGVWTPDPSLAGANGKLASEQVWAALDCPGYFAVRERAGLALLGRIAARIDRLPGIGETAIVTGWSIASEGRKHRVGTAIHDRDGQLLAGAIATWITIG